MTVALKRCDLADVNMIILTSTSLHCTERRRIWEASNWAADLGSLFKKPETVLYLRAETGPGGLKGHIENDAERCILCGICAKSCPADAIVVEKGAHLAIDPFCCVQYVYCGARLPSALPDHGSRLHAHRHREIPPRGACPRPKAAVTES